MWWTPISDEWLVVSQLGKANVVNSLEGNSHSEDTMALLACAWEELSRSVVSDSCASWQAIVGIDTSTRSNIQMRAMHWG